MRPGAPSARSTSPGPAHARLFRLRDVVLDRGDSSLAERWRRLTTSDHLYYMCTKWFADGDVHKYFSPCETPYDAFITFMNVLQDLEQQVTPANAAAAATTALAV